MSAAIRRVFPLFLTAFLLLCPFSVAAAPTDGEEIEQIVITGERNTIPENVHYYNGQNRYTSANYRPDSNIFRWDSGRNNRAALVLDGNEQFLRLPNTALSGISSFTFTSWVYWNGTDTRDDDKGQKLMTLYNNEYHYLLVSLHAVDTAVGLNGIMIEWITPGSESERIYTVADESSCFAFPTGQWHHVALTVSTNSVTLYIDGLPHLTADIDLRLSDMQSPKLRVGASFAATEKRMCGLLQDTVAYTAALDANQILLSAQDGDPLSGETATTATDPLATRPSSSAVMTERDEEHTGLIFGIPAGLVGTLAFILGAVVLLSILLSIVGSRQKKEEEK